MSISVHTNQSALIALQNLNKTNDGLAEAQDRISTGLKVQGPKDNASVWGIAQAQRADLGSLSAVKMSLDRASSIADVTLAAGESISDLLIEIKQKVVAAMDPSLDSAARTALDSDFKALIRQISQSADAAEFDGANLLNGSLTSNISFLANAAADDYVTLSTSDFSLGGSIITVASTASITTATLASAVLTDIETSIGLVNQSLGDLGAQAKQIEAHSKFVTKLQDVLTSGIGNLVDADLAKESARLQALQVQQQLGAQALSIANSAPQIILSLFKGG